MAYEATGRHGRMVASMAGGGLLFLAVLVVSSEHPGHLTGLNAEVAAL